MVDLNYNKISEKQRLVLVQNDTSLRSGGKNESVFLIGRAFSSVTYEHLEDKTSEQTNVAIRFDYPAFVNILWLQRLVWTLGQVCWFMQHHQSLNVL